MTLADQIESILGQRPLRTSSLQGGCIAEVHRIDMPDGTRLVAKTAGKNGTLDIEAWMLQYLAQHSTLPVPRIIHSEPSLLLMDYIEGSSRFSAQAETHAAELLADLHNISAPTFGLERNTLIGPLHQPNPQSNSWIDFFRDHRLLHMAQVASDSGNLPRRTHDRLHKLAENLDDLLHEPDHPSLLHGDVWTTNILAQGERITGFIDPAIYYGHPEIELAFTTLFGTFAKGGPFITRYSELRPIRPGFFEQRCDLYNLYPLLVHTKLFGPTYAAQIDSTLARLNL